MARIEERKGITADSSMAAVFGSLLLVITFADTHSHTYYIRRSRDGRRTKETAAAWRREARQGKESNMSNVYEYIYMRAAISYAGHARRVAGERVRFIRRTSHTKGAIVEIRIRPKHITYDRPEPGGTIGAVRRAAVRAQQSSLAL